MVFIIHGKINLKFVTMMIYAYFQFCLSKHSTANLPYSRVFQCEISRVWLHSPRIPDKFTSITVRTPRIIISSIVPMFLCFQYLFPSKNARFAHISWTIRQIRLIIIKAFQQVGVYIPIMSLGGQKANAHLSVMFSAWTSQKHMKSSHQVGHGPIKSAQWKLRAGYLVHDARSTLLLSGAFGNDPYTTIYRTLSCWAD